MSSELDNDWSLLARKADLTNSDVFRLVRYEGQPLREGMDDGFLAVSRDGIRLSPQLTAPDAFRLLNSEEQAFLLDLERLVRLDFPCTPEELLAWYERNSESSPILSEEGVVTVEPEDVLELRQRFVDVLRPRAPKKRGGRPKVMTPELENRIKGAISGLNQSTQKKGAIWIALSEEFTNVVFGRHKKCSTPPEYRREYGIGLRAITDVIRKALK
jgi:hypothetical protein